MSKAIKVAVVEDDDYIRKSLSELVNGAANLTTSFAQPGYQLISALYSGNLDYNSSSSQLLSVNVLMNPTATRGSNASATSAALP